MEENEDVKKIADAAEELMRFITSIMPEERQIWSQKDLREVQDRALDVWSACMVIMREGEPVA